jgi:hypothetical protein
MTTHKGFKQLVRARVAKTGERYAAARRAMLAGTTPQPAAATERGPAGLHPESAALTRVLADGGVTSPFADGPLTESMILGIGGGLGAGYILWQFKARGDAILTIGFRNRWQYPAIPGWYLTVLERLGVEADLHETSGAGAARAALDEALDQGMPAIALIDQQAIGSWGQPAALSGIWGYPVVVLGRTGDGDYLVDDRGRESLVVDAATMARARGRIGSYKHRLIVPRPVPGRVDGDRLRTAIRDGLVDQVQHLRSPSDSFSLPAWRKWSRMMTDERNPKGWPRVFAGGDGLLGALVSVVESVDGSVGGSGGHLREHYARFLDDVADVLESPGLRVAAERWREAADRWEDLADAAVPPDLEGATAAVAAAEALHAAVMLGEPGRAAARAAAERLWTLRDQHATSPAFAETRMATLFAELGERLAGIHEAETAAIEATAAAIGA